MTLSISKVITVRIYPSDYANREEEYANIGEESRQDDL